MPFINSKSLISSLLALQITYPSLIKYDDKLHVIFIKEGYVICNANREEIRDLELIKGISNLNSKMSFQETSVRILDDNMVRLMVKIPHDVLTRIKNDQIKEDEELDKPDNYFWNVFHKDLQNLTEHCQKISLIMNNTQDLRIELFLNNDSNNFIDQAKRVPLRFRDLEEVLNFIDKVYNEFYVIWV
jgi:replicative DNA helicase